MSKHRSKSLGAAQANSGLGRVEILLGIVVALVAAIFLSTAFAGRVEQSRVGTASQLVDDVAGAISAYEKDRGTFPVSLAALVRGESPYLAMSDEPTDPWGNRLKYDVTNGKVLVRSSGPDRTFATDDDITSQ